MDEKTVSLVNRGMAYLDAIMLGWEDRIDLDTLCMG